MFFGDMSWMDVERYLESDDRVVLITGACEQHGYLSLLTDIRIPEAIARGLVEQSGVLVAPPLNFGCSPYFSTYPGTISLSAATFSAVLREVIVGLHGSGFRRLLLLNGHGGNGSIEPLLSELAGELPGLRAAAYHWWRDRAAQELGRKLGAVPTHANWLENFPFTRVGPVAPGEKPFPQRGSATLGPAEARATFGDGSFGGVYQQPDDVMAELLTAAIAEASDVLQRL